MLLGGLIFDFVQNVAPSVPNLVMILELLTTTAGSLQQKHTYEPVDLSKFSSAEELEKVGLEHLKAELQRYGLKGGGSLAERAARLFLVSHTPVEKIDKKQLARPVHK